MSRRWVPRTLLDGLTFAESPRWRDGRLWFSDIFAHRVMTVDESGRAEVVVEFTGGERPSGLGFLPDGRLLIVNLSEPNILRLDTTGEVVVHADLSELAVGGLNDMVVDDQGRAYVGSMGTHSNAEKRPVDADGVVILVEADGRARVVAERLDAPNGPAFLDGGDTYVVAEFPAQRLTAYDRGVDGSLSARRTWADLAPAGADGISVDPAEGIWCASPWTSDVRRVLEGGAVADVVGFGDRMPLACAVGGHDGRTLFVLSCVGGAEAIAARTCTSVIETVRLAS
ncbi:gluconolaconase [Streptomyces dioscori]|uniref:Gluconolaconase n=1 Tax=Streptomyces dioscori TaxID=2109333 RepID=A0A2P8PYE8_9ACTN|nr:SMP-30/gluconolactonase/LRE family protein [Streptomyces dioscori]PSM39023.1 gluconolaconase [Streptomyces dioscori]